MDCVVLSSSQTIQGAGLVFSLLVSCNGPHSKLGCTSSLIDPGFGCVGCVDPPKVSRNAQA